MISNIRNFCIIAHVDHGKSTLADRLLELTGSIEKRKMREQFLDMHPLEREKGITIKMQPVRMMYKDYILNLIDTPGHVDFTYEVSRALAAVEGAILLVDATQGVQAQTIANLHLAQKAGLKIIPVLNKIDLPSAEVEKSESELRALLNLPIDEDILKVSAKSGEGVGALLDLIIKDVPPPRIPPEDYPKALVFDSMFDSYQGVIAFVRVFQGSLKKGDQSYFMASQSRGEIKEIGIFLPDKKIVSELGVGEIGYVVTGTKEPEVVKVGDTVTKYADPLKLLELKPLSGYQEPAPMVFASVFPEDQDDYAVLGESLKKLKLSDAAIIFEPEQSTAAMGRGYRIGFLGMLHMEIVSERLKREYNLNLVFSNPSVSFKIETKDGQEIIYSPSKMPSGHLIMKISEPWVKMEIITPPSYLGILTSLLTEKSGRLLETTDLAGGRLMVKAEAPLREVVVDFYDKLKSISQGFASMAYEVGEYRTEDLVRLDILVAGEDVPAFTEILPRDKAYYLGRAKLEKLKELLPRELFAVALQAVIEGKVVARETIPAMKKDVTAHMYGGDRTRKMKLWKKQQKGKKRLLASAHVDIPADIFLKMIKKN